MVLFFRAAPEAHGGSQARGPVRAIAAGLPHSSPQRRILSSPCEARDWTRILVDARWIRFCSAPAGAPEDWWFYLYGERVNFDRNLKQLDVSCGKHPPRVPQTFPFFKLGLGSPQTTPEAAILLVTHVRCPGPGPPSPHPRPWRLPWTRPVPEQPDRGECLQGAVSALGTFGLASYLNLPFAFSVRGILMCVSFSLGGCVSLAGPGEFTQQPVFIKAWLGLCGATKTWSLL